MEQRGLALQVECELSVFMEMRNSSGLVHAVSTLSPGIKENIQFGQIKEFELCYMPNAVVRKDLQTPTDKKKSAATALSTVLASAQTPKRPSSEPHGAARQQAIAKTPAK
jgi:hypothetical protein